MDWMLIAVMGALLVFMFWSSRRRAQKAKAEQEAKARAMVPGVKVLLQGGLYGTLVSYDGEDLSKSALVSLAPGVEVEVHSQAILRAVEDAEDEVVPDESLTDASDDEVSSPSDDTAADSASGDKPQA
ncbi:MAG: preprotein translocase subunit YajC [Microbacterium sp.]